MTDRRPLAAIPPAEAGRLEFLVPDEGQRSSIADLVAMGADPAGAWPRLISMIEANPDLVLTSPALERACAIRASRAMSQAIARRPALMVGSAPDDSVPLRLRASLATIAGDDLAGVIDMTVATTRFSDAIDDLVRDVQSRTTAAIARSTHWSPTSPSRSSRWGNGEPAS